MNNRHIHIDWYFKVLLLALLLALGVEQQACGYTVRIIDILTIHNGGKDVKPATIRIREHKLDFTLPDIPQFTYNPKTEEIETTDAKDNPQIIKVVLHADCRESASSQRESFKNAVIEDESGHVLCHQDEYLCKARQMISIALSELVADNCKVAHTVGSVVGPIAVMCIGDVAAGEAVLTRLGSVGSGLKYAIKGLQLCDKVTDITRPLAKGLKVATVLVKKATPIRDKPCLFFALK